MDAAEIARLREELLENGTGLFHKPAIALLDALEQERKERDGWIDDANLGRQREADIRRERAAQATQIAALLTAVIGIIHYAEHYTDEGPPDEGWQSPEVKRALAAAPLRA